MSRIAKLIFMHFHAALPIFTALIVTPSLAQLNAKYLTQHTELDSLPGIRVSNLVADRQGYICTGTINGLARFDGYEFKRNPQKVLEKIFQPFFTTKPTGEGTGLGLSLSYDIVKAHGGEVKVETKEGEGSEFVNQL